MAEAVYVLVGRYRRPRNYVVSALLTLIQNAGVERADGAVVTDALRRFAATDVDFTDAWLAARAAHLGYGIASFDRDLDKLKDVKRVEPKG